MRLMLNVVAVHLVRVTREVIQVQVAGRCCGCSEKSPLAFLLLGIWLGLLSFRHEPIGRLANFRISRKVQFPKQDERMGLLS